MFASLAACGGGDETPEATGSDAAPAWEEGGATVTLEVDGATVATFDDGICQRGRASSGIDSFRLRAGEPGANGEGIIVGIVLELGPGATFDGDETGNGVQVDHASVRWQLRNTAAAVRFDEDLRGGTILLVEEDGTTEAEAIFEC